MSVERLSDKNLADWIEVYDRGPVGSALRELQQLRAAKAADRDRVRRVVARHAVEVVPVRNYETYDEWANALAARVADALAVPVRGLSDQDRADLEAIRDEHAMRIQQNFNKSPDVDADSKRVVALMDRLLGKETT